MTNPTQALEEGHMASRDHAHTADVALDARGPRRVQLSRAKGWRMPPNTVKVDRSTRYGNPFVPGILTTVTAPSTLAETVEEAVQLFRQHAPSLIARRGGDIGKLRGKNLACWCRPDELCHADVLLEMANAPPRADVEGEP